MKYLFTILIFIPLFCNAQISFFRSYGGSGNDFGEAVITTSDTCYLVVGATESFGNGVTDLYVFKVDSLGDYIWSRTYGGPNIDYGTDVIEMEDGSFLLSGYSNSSSMDYDFYLVKISSTGQHQWTRTYGGNDWDLAYAICKINHSSSGYVMAGETYSYGAGSTDGYLIKVNALGDTLWTQTYGGNNADGFKDIIEDTNGNLICIGTTSSNTTYNDADIWVVKLDSLGNELWNYVHSDTLDDEGTSICLAKNGDYLFAGNDQQPNNYSAFFGIRPVSGSLNFYNDYNGPLDEFSSTIIRHQDSSSYSLIGNTNSWGNGSLKVLFTQLNGAWSFLPLTGYSGTQFDDFSNGADTTADHSIIIVGSTEGTLNGLSSAFLLKNDQNYSSLTNLTEDLDLSSAINYTTSSISIYPNPVKSNAYISGYSENNEVYIWNVQGKLISKYTLNGNSINLEHLNPGIYLISYQQEITKSVSFIKL